MSEMDSLPVSTHSSTLSVMGVELIVHQLSNGQRIIEAEGMGKLFEAMASGAPLSEDDAMKLAKVVRVS